MTTPPDLVPGCYNCEHGGEGSAPWQRVHEEGLWRVALALDSSLPGWLVVVPQRHVEGLHEVSPDDAAVLGRLLQRASAALVEVTGCVKTYVMLFAEAEGFAHLHVHVVPRAADLPPEHRGPKVFAYLDAPADQQPSEHDRDELAAALGAVLTR